MRGHGYRGESPHIECQMFGNQIHVAEFKLLKGADDVVVASAKRPDGDGGETAWLTIQSGTQDAELLQKAVDTAVEQVAEKWECSVCYLVGPQTTQLVIQYEANAERTEFIIFASPDDEATEEPAA